MSPSFVWSTSYRERITRLPMQGKLLVFKFSKVSKVYSIPADLRLLNISLPVFRKRLKMFLF